MMFHEMIPEVLGILEERREQEKKRHKRRKIIKGLKIAFALIAGYLFFRFIIYPHSDAVLVGIGLKPKDFISPEVYGGAIQSLVTAFTILATFYIYNKSKKDVLSQKVYDKKFETYSLLWEKLEQIEKQMDANIKFIWEADLKKVTELIKEVEDFEETCKAKSLVISTSVMELLLSWAACCWMELSCIKDISKYENIEDLEQLDEWEEYCSANTGKIVAKEQLILVMKMELGLQVLEEEIDASFGNVSRQIKELCDELEKLFKEREERGEEILYQDEDEQDEEQDKQPDEQSDDHLTDSNDQGKAI